MKITDQISLKFESKELKILFLTFVFITILFSYSFIFLNIYF